MGRGIGALLAGLFANKVLGCGTFGTIIVIIIAYLILG